jgi:hypothetical protein
MAKNKILYEGAFEQSTRNKINNNFSDVSLCTTQFDAVTGTTGTTLTNVVGMVTDTLDAGTYKFKITVPCVATANTGIKMALKWGTASMITSAEYEAKAFTASGVAVTRGTTATDAVALLDSTAGVVIFAEITGVFVVALSGTLQFQAAQHTAHADTVSVYVNAQMQFEKIATN